MKAMKIRITTLLLLLLSLGYCSFAQNVGISTDGSTPDNSAMLDVKSTSKGVLIPRMSQEERLGISNPAKGLLIFQTNEVEGFYYNQGTPASPDWQQLGATGPVGEAGSPGAIGVAGTNGLSAYQVWLSLGNVGSETDFIASLTGPQGPVGPQGIQGIQGATGAQGPQGEHAPCNGVPPAPSMIYGSACGSAIVSIDPVPGATSYEWGWSNGQFQGNGTSFIKETLASGITYIYVKAVNACGSSGETRIYTNQVHGIAKFTPATTGTSASMFKVPCNVDSLKIEIAGAGGGAGFAEITRAPGGGGAYLKGAMKVSANEVYVLNAGARGGDATYNGGGLGGKGGNVTSEGGDHNGGNGGGNGTTVFMSPACSSPGYGSGGGGGGGSDIRLITGGGDDFGSGYTFATIQDIKVAVGGGGGGGSSNNTTTNTTLDKNVGGKGGFNDGINGPTSGIYNGNLTSPYSDDGNTLNSRNGITGRIGNVSGRDCNTPSVSRTAPGGSGGGGGGGGESGQTRGGGGHGGNSLYPATFKPEIRTVGGNAGDGYIIVRW